jgi:hypothetical protein
MKQPSSGASFISNNINIIYLYTLCLLLILYLIIKAKSINSNNLRSSIILHNPCNKSLREKESTEPENLRSTILSPFLKEVTSLIQIISPTSQRFQRKETNITPHIWHLIVKYTISQSNQFITHSNSTIQSQFNQFQ